MPRCTDFFPCYGKPKRSLFQVAALHLNSKAAHRCKERKSLNSPINSVSADGGMPLAALLYSAKGAQRAFPAGRTQ